MSVSFSHFTATEKRNLAIYIVGIMVYKFALEALNGSMSGLVLNRYNYVDPALVKKGGIKQNDGAKSLWAQMQGVNVVCQCVGSLLVGPFVKRFHAKTVMATAVLLFGLAAAVGPILEATSGGKIPGADGSKNPRNWGTWDVQIVFALFGICGIFHGMVELMRRVIPADIVGGDVVKLKQMDAVVHIFYEITGTIGAIFGYIWLGFFGWGYNLGLLTVGMTLASLMWTFITPRPEKVIENEEYRLANKNVYLFTKKVEVFYSFFHSIYFGAKLIFTQRALIWLIPAYTLPLVLHRYLENSVFAFYAKSALKNSDLQQIMTGGSNFGELLGAIAVLFLASKIKTPIPWLRLDVLFLMAIWALPFLEPNVANPYSTAWTIAPIASVISFGWAAGDVSLAAYVQSRLDGFANIDKFTSPLGAVMSFLYASYLVIFFFTNLAMARLNDDWTDVKSTKEIYIWVAGVFMTACSAIVLASTFIPRGAFSWNPDPDSIRFDDDYVVDGKVLAKRTGDEKDSEFLGVA